MGGAYSELREEVLQREARIWCILLSEEINQAPKCIGISCTAAELHPLIHLLWCLEEDFTAAAKSFL